MDFYSYFFRPMGAAEPQKPPFCFSSAVRMRRSHPDHQGKSQGRQTSFGLKAFFRLQQRKNL